MLLFLIFCYTIKTILLEVKAMTNNEFLQISKQIEKYKLTRAFESVEELKKWLSKLTTLQIKNFLSLSIDINEIMPIRDLLINKDLLNCTDYTKRVNAISKLKNGNGCWQLFDALCSKAFLQSNKFYDDIELMSKAYTLRYALLIISNEEFIKSPYHNEDLRLIVNTTDYDKSENLAFVAEDSNSIKSPYHHADMQLMASSKSSIDWYHLQKLACDNISLGDKYHLENMRILADNKAYAEELWSIMIHNKVIAGQNYRKEIEAIVNAKSKKKAIATCYYIACPEKTFQYYVAEDSLNFDFFDETNYFDRSIDNNYLSNLASINDIDDKFLKYYVKLLINHNFINSQNESFDLKLLKQISDKNIFSDLCSLMGKKAFSTSSYHQQDSLIISKTESAIKRDLLIKKAVDENSIEIKNHEYDMEYITNLDLGIITDEIYSEIKYYLFDTKKIDENKRRWILNQLNSKIMVERPDPISDYLNTLTLESKISPGNKASSHNLCGKMFQKVRNHLPF